MLTKFQKRTLAMLVRQNQHILFAKFGPNVTRKKKEAIWTAIHQRLISLGADLPNVRYVRDFEWGNLKRAAAKRCAENRMTDLDKIVMDIVTGSNNSNPDEDPDSEKIEVTPIILDSFGIKDEPEPLELIQGSSSTTIRQLGSFSSPIPLSKFQRDAFMSVDQGTNGHDEYPPGGSSGDLDIEVLLLKKQKVEYENELLRLQMSEIRESGKRDREKYKLDVTKMEAEIQTEKLRAEKVRQELVVLKLQSEEIKARTRYFAAAKSSLAENSSAANVDPLNLNSH